MHQQLPRLQPAAAIVEMLGGEEWIARQLGVERVTVYRWQWPSTSNSGGRDGYIPRRNWPGLIRLGKSLGIELTDDDFVRVAKQAA